MCGLPTLTVVKHIPPGQAPVKILHQPFCFQFFVILFKPVNVGSSLLFF